jgi:hypothetical protein
MDKALGKIVHCALFFTKTLILALKQLKLQASEGADGEE